MNSCLYECDVMHYRLEPKKHRFHYRLFMFFLDLDELDAWHRRLRLFSRNARNIFSFRDADHLRRGAATTKENILVYLRSHNVDLEGGRIMLLTHPRMFGHLFNPVSFYFCFDAEDRPVCSVVEVQNTFREMKPYFLGRDAFADGRYAKRTPKDFYVSPFIALDAHFDFRLSLPGARVGTYIDDYENGRRFFLSSLTGVRKPLNDAQLLRYTVRFPLITLKILFLIHWQAFRLWLKGVAYLKKDDHPEMQVGYQSMVKTKHPEVFHAPHA